MQTISNVRIHLYQQIAQHTFEDCKTHCTRIDRCCSPDYCAEADKVLARYDVTVAPTGHAELKYMGPNGCVLPPHLRPKCALFVCWIVDHGRKPGDIRWTEKYHEIAREIAKLEIKER